MDPPGCDEVESHAVCGHRGQCRVRFQPVCQHPQCLGCLLGDCSTCFRSLNRTAGSHRHMQCAFVGGT